MNNVKTCNRQCKSTFSAFYLHLFRQSNIPSFQYLLLENISLPVGHLSPSFRELALVFQGLYNQHKADKKDRLHIFRRALKVF